MRERVWHGKYRESSRSQSNIYLCKLYIYSSKVRERHEWEKESRMRARVTNENIYLCKLYIYSSKARLNRSPILIRESFVTVSLIRDSVAAWNALSCVTLSLIHDSLWHSWIICECLSHSWLGGGLKCSLICDSLSHSWLSLAFVNHFWVSLSFVTRWRLEMLSHMWLSLSFVTLSL